MATWHQQKKVWIASKQVKGNRQFFQAETEAEADALAREWKPVRHGPTFNSETFAAFVYGPWKANNWENLRPKSRVKYQGQLKAHILPVLGALPISEIGLDEMIMLKNSLKLKGKKRPGEPMANRTAASVLTLAMGILLLAKAAGKTKREDWKLVKKPKFRKKIVRQELPETFTADMLGAAEGTWMAGPIFAAMFLGLRLGEVCGLKWSAISRKALTIDVSIQRQRMTGKGTVESPTKGDPRILYVGEDMLGYLDRFGDRGSIYVFTGAEGMPIKPDKITKKMESLCKEAEVPKVTFHGLRAYAASNLTALGAPVPVVMSILGHTKADISMLYIDARKAEIRAAFAKVLEKMA